MKKRYIWFAASVLALVVVIIAVVMAYMAHFASAVNQSQTHVASGAITVTATPIPSTGLQTFQIVSNQTNASYYYSPT